MLGINISKMKLLDVPRYYSKFKIYNPRKLKYLTSEKYGYFEAPNVRGNRELKMIVNNYQQRVEYEKYMNPKGLKYSFTSRFPKFGDQHDFLNFNAFLVRTGKQIDSNSIKFKIPKNLSKPELKQYLSKLYSMNIEKITTSILPGNVRYDSNQKRYIRTKDVKKAVVTINKEVDKNYQKI